MKNVDDINFMLEIRDRQQEIDIVYNSATHIEKRKKRDLLSKIKFNKNKPNEQNNHSKI